jgi:hypothetical protein
LNAARSAFHDDLRLSPDGEVVAFVDLVEVDEVGSGLVRSVPPSAVSSSDRGGREVGALDVDASCSPSGGTF